MQILPVGNKQSFGASLGSGISSALQGLAQHKVATMHREKQEDELSRLLQGANYNEPNANLLAHLYQLDPQNFHKLLAQASQGNQDQGQQVFGGGGSEAQSIAKAKLQQQRELAEDKAIEPFLKGQAEDFNSAKRLYSKAKSMLDNLEKNKKKWPGQLRGTIASDKSYTDPDIRAYLADSASLVSALASSRKGQPTNFKIKFEQLSKPDLSMPYETQKKLLKGIINDAEDVFKTQKFLSSERQKGGGRIPSDIRQRLIEGGVEDILGKKASSGEEYRGDFRTNKKTGVTQRWNPESGSYEAVNKGV